jgi:hypothetical protein
MGKAAEESDTGFFTGRMDSAGRSGFRGNYLSPTICILPLCRGGYVSGNMPDWREAAGADSEAVYLSANSGRKVTPVSFIAAICCSHSSCCFFKPRRLVILSHSSTA